ncbi:ribosomal protein S19 binding protein 1 isoform X2 [Boleophthalmus pectinirostris]|uniref:ribosomal protein S19 binding protein 1 isoform X2 n=1 Tax=Boleophthalmus pectinirostris TaxID=150288 RepID=UPI000A1C2122|nr:ribosomal protein S19 binding protein 1 isoform X2 [Boleophthalmus pectinirostris]
MSAALVRRGLELLSADVSDGPDGKKKKTKQKASGSKRSSRVPPPGHHRGSAKGRKMRSALEEASRGQQKEHTAVTLQYFLHSGSSGSEDQTAKIIRQNSGRQSKNSVGAPAQRPQEPKSVFTEEEFQQFQKEYFGRTVEEQ